MARTKGSYNVNTGRFIIADQFSHLPDPLAMWNVMNVAFNLAEIGGEQLAERYLAVNTQGVSEAGLIAMAKHIRKMRHNMYGLRAGDSPYTEDMGRISDALGWTKRLDS